MPTYDYHCPRCKRTHEQVHPMLAAPDGCPHCGFASVQKAFLHAPRVKVPDSGWQAENNGRGRYIGQLAARPDVDDPNAYCRSQAEAIEKAKRQGWKHISKV